MGTKRDQMKDAMQKDRMRRRYAARWESNLPNIARRRERELALHRAFSDAGTYICPACRATADPTEPAWRWSEPDGWSHYHGYPVGHVPALQLPAAAPGFVRRVKAAFRLVFNL